MGRSGIFRGGYFPVMHLMRKAGSASLKKSVILLRKRESRFFRLAELACVLQVLVRQVCGHTNTVTTISSGEDLHKSQ